MLQAIINKFISLDTSISTQRLLQALQNKNIAIICTDLPQQHLYCTFDNQQVLLASAKPEHVDTTISSTLAGFIQFMLTQKNTGININGDAMLAELVQKLYLQLNIDWEEQLSHFTGDIIAHQTLKLLKQYKQQQIYATNSIGEMITEYLQEEAAILPTSYEVSHFLQEVDNLRLSMDRLEARFKLYENN